MTSIEATRVDLRPMRSPKWPNRTEPTGRARKAMPNVKKAFSACDCGAESGKNVWPITKAAAVP